MTQKEIPYKECEYCQKVFYKKQNVSKANWVKSKYCSKDCCCKVTVVLASNATRGTKLSEEKKANLPNLFQKGHTKHGLHNLEKYRAEGGQAWNKGVFGYHVHGGIKRTDLKRNIRDSRKGQIREKAVLERDNYTCQDCGKIKEKRGDVEVHHIKPFADILTEHKIDTFEKAYDCTMLRDTTNGKVLCRGCHHKYKLFRGSQYETNICL